MYDRAPTGTTGKRKFTNCTSRFLWLAKSSLINLDTPQNSCLKNLENGLTPIEPIEVCLPYGNIRMCWTSWWNISYESFKVIRQSGTSNITTIQFQVTGQNMINITTNWEKRNRNSNSNKPSPALPSPTIVHKVHTGRGRLIYWHELASHWWQYCNPPQCCVMLLPRLPQPR